MCTNATTNSTSCNIKVVDPTAPDAVQHTPFDFIAAFLEGKPVCTTKGLRAVPRYAYSTIYSEANYRGKIAMNLVEGRGDVVYSDVHFDIRTGKPTNSAYGDLVMGNPQKATIRWVNVRVTKQQKIFIGETLWVTEGKAKQAALRGNTKTLATVAVEINPSRTTVEGLTIVM